MEVDPDAKVEVEDYVVDYSKDPYNFWNSVAEATIGINSAEGCLEIVNPAPPNRIILFNIIQQIIFLQLKVRSIN